MADDGNFKGHGGKPGRKSTVISMSAHKNRHTSVGTGARSDFRARTDFQPLTDLTDAKTRILPCEGSPFERDVDLDKNLDRNLDLEEGGRKKMRWGLDESAGDALADEVEEEISLGKLAAARLKDGGNTWDHKVDRSGSVGESFYHAINGLKVGFSGQRNVRIHCVISAMVFILALLLQVDYAGCLALILATGLVLFAEYVNTALEHITDIQAHFQHHQSAKLAKDTAAAAVLIAAATAVLVGATVFAPRLYVLLVN